MRARNIDRWETAGALLSAVVMAGVAVGALFGLVYAIKSVILWGIGG